jgi:hypothetical protein
MNDLFIVGFMEASGIFDIDRAKEQWAGWSHQLSDKEREAVEAEGYHGGLREGRIYADHHVEH